MPIGQENNEDKFKYLSYFPLPYIGVSILQSFDACPVSFYFRYYHDIVFKPNDKMKFGITFQDALTAKYKGEEYLPILGSLTKKNYTKAKSLLDKSHEFKDILYYDEYMTADLGLGIPVRFAADMITRHEIVENKTTSGYYNAEMARKQNQGSLYFECVRRLLGLELPIKYQIFNIPNNTCELVVLEKTSADSLKVINWMRDTLQKIETCYTSGNWVTKNHGKYSCDLGKSCPCL